MAKQTDDTSFRVLICDCEGTNRLDRSALERAAGTAADFTGTQLCRRQLGEVEARFADGGPLLIGCTQEAPLFLEAAEEAGFSGELRFANLREKAGWSLEGKRAGAKMGALLAEVLHPVGGPGTVTMRSEGSVLVLGLDDVAVDAAKRLGQRMDVVLVLLGAEDAAPPRTIEVPIFHGAAVKAAGHLGAFELEVKDFAAMTPSARGQLSFEPAATDWSSSSADIILDLRGGAPAPWARVRGLTRKRTSPSFPMLGSTPSWSALRGRTWPSSSKSFRTWKAPTPRR